MNPVLKALQFLDQKYAAGQPVLTDEQYDLLYDNAKMVWPNDSYFKKVGAKLPAIKGKRIEVKLPRQMRSLEKKRPTGAMEWVAKCPKNAEFVLTPKLDGVALLIEYIDGVLHKVYTRGEDGVTGFDVTKNAKHIQGILPKITRRAKHSPIKGHLYVSAECICHKSIFDKYFSKYTGKGDKKNARNFTVGLINRLTQDTETVKSLNKLTAVVYGLHRVVNGKPVYHKNKIGELIQAGFHGFTTTLMPSRWKPDLWKKFKKGSIPTLAAKDYPPQVFKPLNNYWHPDRSTLSVDILNQLLKSWRDSPDLDVLQDGLVLEVAQHELRKKMGFTDSRPGYAYAVKPEQKDQVTLTGEVKELRIQISPRRIFKPVAILKTPLIFQGVEVTNVTLHDMSKVVKNQVNVGAKIKVARSGDVIPFYLGTVKPVPYKPFKVCPHCNTKVKWTRNDDNEKVNLYCPNTKCPGPNLRQLTHFFKVMEIEGMAKGVIANMIKAGLDTIPKILVATPKDLSKVEGFATKKISNITKELKRVCTDVKLPILAHASNCFNTESTGLGTTILELIINKLGKKTVLDEPVDLGKLQLKLLTVPGIGPERAKIFAENLLEFRRFAKNLSGITLAKENSTVGKLTGKVFCFTNFRDKDLKNKLILNGGKVSESLTNQVTVLFAAGESDKTRKAEDKGITIVQKANAEKYIDSLLRE